MTAPLDGSLLVRPPIYNMNRNNGQPTAFKPTGNMYAHAHLHTATLYGTLPENSVTDL